MVMTVMMMDDDDGVVGRVRMEVYSNRCRGWTHTIGTYICQHVHIHMYIDTSWTRGYIYMTTCTHVYEHAYIFTHTPSTCVSLSAFWKWFKFLRLLLGWMCFLRFLSMCYKEATRIFPPVSTHLLRLFSSEAWAVASGWDVRWLVQFRCWGWCLAFFFGVA
jgi:hypothetical protein